MLILRVLNMASFYHMFSVCVLPYSDYHVWFCSIYAEELLVTMKILIHYTTLSLLRGPTMR